jgi:hypothetical protein
VCEGVLDGFALRVEHRFLGCNNDFCFHLKTEMPPFKLASKCG